MESTERIATSRLLICVDNDGGELDLELLKTYEAIPDETLEPDDVRVVGESGEDYIYPLDCFVPAGLVSLGPEMLTAPDAPINLLIARMKFTQALLENLKGLRPPGIVEEPKRFRSAVAAELMKTARNLEDFARHQLRGPF